MPKIIFGGLLLQDIKEDKKIDEDGGSAHQLFVS